MSFQCVRQLLVLPSIFMAGFAMAQTGCSFSLSGRVIDEHDRQPLAYAEVYLPDLAKGVVADELGNYRITGLCAGTYVLRVTHLGCEPIEQRVRISADLVLDLRMEHHAEELREFEIAQQRPDENVGQAHGQLEKEAMERNAGKSLGEMLATIPGVNMLSSGPTISKPVIHGLSGNRIQIGRASCRERV